MGYYMKNAIGIFHIISHINKIQPYEIKHPQVDMSQGSSSSSSWCLGRAAVCDCGTPWTFLLPFFDIGYDMKNFISIFIFYHTFFLMSMV